MSADNSNSNSNGNSSSNPVRSIADLSHEELIQFALDAQAQLLQQGNHPPTACCPVCYGTGYVSLLKCQIRAAVLVEWNRDVTQEELEAWEQKQREREDLRP